MKRSRERIRISTTSGAVSSNWRVPSRSVHNRVESKGGRREYPLFFLLRASGSIEFVGNWDVVEKMIDAGNQSPAVLNEHPEVITLSRLFYKKL